MEQPHSYYRVKTIVDQLCAVQDSFINAEDKNTARLNAIQELRRLLVEGRRVLSEADRPAPRRALYAPTPTHRARWFDLLSVILATYIFEALIVLIWLAFTHTTPTCN